MPPRGATSRHLFAPFFPPNQSPPLPHSPTNRPQHPPPPTPTTNPHLFPTLRTTSPKHLLPPTVSPSHKQPSLKPPHTTLSTRFSESIPRTPASHVLRCSTESTLRVPATQGLPHPTTYREPYEALSMLGVVYTRVHSCVHTCTVMYTRVYNRAFIPISF